MAFLLLLTSRHIEQFPGLEIPLSFAIALVSYCGAWLLLPGGSKKLKEYLSYPLLALRLRTNPK
jgi:hypothetical protein